MRGDAKYYERDEAKGGYRYNGKYYRFTLVGSALARKKRIFLTLSLLSIGAFFLAGYADAGETRAFYVGIPYVFFIIPSGLGLAAAYNTLCADESMTYPQYRKGPKRLILCTRVGSVLAAAALIGCIVLKFRGGAGGLFFPLSLVLMLAASAAIWALYARGPARPTT